jgi:serine/threonine-protein kinase
LLDLTQDEAEKAIDQAGLTVGDVRFESHPTAARGDVFWQDPPSGVGVQRGHTVQLTVSSGPQRIPVPDLTGYDASVAEQLILAGGLVVGRREMTQAPAPRGVVINTRPPAGMTLLPGSEVTIVVSVGAPTITVPDLEGLTREEADSVLVDAGLSLGTAVRRTNRDWPPGTVMAQTPPPGTLSAPGTAVNITLARERNP